MIIVASALLHGLLFTAIEIVPKMRSPLFVKPEMVTVDPLETTPLYEPVRESRPRLALDLPIDPSSFTYCPAPQLPRGLRVEGVVRLHLVIGTDGAVRE